MHEKQTTRREVSAASGTASCCELRVEAYSSLSLYFSLKLPQLYFFSFGFWFVVFFVTDYCRFAIFSVAVFGSCAQRRRCGGGGWKEVGGSFPKPSWSVSSDFVTVREVKEDDSSGDVKKRERPFLAAVSNWLVCFVAAARAHFLLLTREEATSQVRHHTAIRR